jgi:hypothetical protein
MKLVNTGWDRKFSNLFTITGIEDDDENLYATVEEYKIVFGDDEEVTPEKFKLDLDARKLVLQKFQQEFGKIK